MAIDTVIFDFDGTIADTNQIIVDSWQEVYRVYTGKSGDLGFIYSTFGEPLYYSMEKAFPDRDVEETVNIYRNFQETIFDRAIKIFDGMEDLIRTLKSRGYKLGIVTSRLRESTQRGLRVFGIEDQIDYIVTVEDTDKHKPDPEPALICLDKLGSKPKNSIMVGDSKLDMGCGKNAGLKTIMVGWSAASTSQDMSEDPSFVPDYIIEKPEDLYDILDGCKREC